MTEEIKNKKGELSALIKETIVGEINKILSDQEAFDRFIGVLNLKGNRYDTTELFGDKVPDLVDDYVQLNPVPQKPIMRKV
jgi:hypothetical protein